MSIQHVQQFARAPSLIAPQHAQDIAALAQAPERNDERSMAAGLQCAQSFYSGADKGKPFPFAGGIAVIPVWGALLHRDRWCDEWATGYSYIESRLSAALGDDDVKGILFDINSYGGHVAGNFELCEQIFAARGRKPMVALVDNRAMSGGYSIASAVGRIIATPSGDAGSIGVVLMHSSYEKMMENLGVKVTFVFAGRHKVDGNPYEDLPDDVRSALQASVEKSYDKFVSLVARNRGIDPEAVRKTEARVYDADEAKSLGLIDDVMAPKDAFASFLSEVSNASTPTSEAQTMSDQNNGTGGSDAPDVTTLQANAATAERQRVGAIVNSDEAKGREALASHFAFNTGMSAEDAVKALAAAPRAEEKKAEAPAAPAAGGGALAAAMAATGGGAGVLPDGGEGEEEQAQGSTLLKAAADLGYTSNKTH